MTKQDAQRRRGRPPLPLPEPINRPMEEIAQTVLQAKPKREDEWDYLREHEAERRRRKRAKHDQEKAED